MPWLYDNPVNFAEESLQGFVAAFGQYVLRVDGGVIRATASPKGQVALVIGGGSGHYPAFSGLVGIGLAAGSACGNMFASPAAAQIYRVAKACDQGGGILLSYGNYAGDVLHFEQAQQRLRTEGIDVRTVVVTDDIASASSSEIHKRRGVAGDLTVFKIAGAAAEAGLNLDEVERLAIKANDNTRSLGVAFSGCTLPGAHAPLFSIPHGQMSLGLGIHGEPGISEHEMPSASALAALLVSRLLAEKPEGAADRIVVILNGLGSVKYEELFLLFGKINSLLYDAKIEIAGTECGELVTSLDMAGLSLTLMWVDSELEKYWNAPTDTPAYRKGSVSQRAHIQSHEIDKVISAQSINATLASKSLAKVALKSLQIARDVIVTNQEELGRLDAIAGDGDHGIGMTRGVEAALSAATLKLNDDAGVCELLTYASEQWSELAGGTSGALWGCAIMAMAQSLGDKDKYSANDLADAVLAAQIAVQTLGKAQIGDKTMVDAILPFTASLRVEIDKGIPLLKALDIAAKTAVQAAVDTSDLSPKLGRARPLAHKSIGHPDPGAVSFGMMMQALADQIDK